ncbi:MAG: hypothetical protein NC826_02485 [Candidatus Omnitrophica bacterium]|nr:hypothetical protein [Candidatus Omnitrophota bacterium]
MMFKKYSKEKERRKYVRLDSVFPVEFYLENSKGEILSDLLQGFTSNVSRGGICLCVNNVSPQLLDIIKNKDTRFILKIEIPLHQWPVEAKAKLTWLELTDERLSRYHFGLSYEEILPSANNRILHYCIAKKITLPLVLCIGFFFLLGLLISTYFNIKLSQANRALVEQFVDILKKTSTSRDRIQKLIKEKEELQLKLEEMELGLRNLQEERQSILELQKKRLIEEEQFRRKINELLKSIKNLEEEREALKEQLYSLQVRESQITENLLVLDKKRADLEKANVEKMYQWLRIHQNQRTGLILSYEGDKDLSNVSFLYDQALTAIAYTKFSDFERAKKIFDFFKFKARRSYGGFLNAYYTNDGQPAEYTVHSGPNFWLGIALAHYINKTNDKSYLGLLKEIADWAIDLQNQDKEGGIRGGPQIEWYSTEHNLDAYAMFNMLYQITANEKYKEAADKIINWLILHAYDRPEVPVRRGKGDSTIATDTYAWSIASLGPEKLESIGINPDKIMEFAEQNCSVEVEYTRPNGERIKIKGFDFAASRHLARGPVISCEWTAQMILSYKIMSKFYITKQMVTKAEYYERKAHDYLNDLFKLLISSPSPIGWGEGCLPYATEDFVDTGHGWVTPKGKSTGSVASTAYGLFSYYGFNPLQF